jgi:hypothetical protein
MMLVVSDDIETDDTLDEDATGRPLGSISFANLDDVDFEEFCFDLLTELGFVKRRLAQGHAEEASPSDRGRDLVA